MTILLSNGLEFCQSNSGLTPLAAPAQLHMDMHKIGTESAHVLNFTTVGCPLPPFFFCSKNYDSVLNTIVL